MYKFWSDDQNTVLLTQWPWLLTCRRMDGLTDRQKTRKHNVCHRDHSVLIRTSNGTRVRLKIFTLLFLKHYGSAHSCRTSPDFLSNSSKTARPKWTILGSIDQRQLGGFWNTGSLLCLHLPEQNCNKRVNNSLAAMSQRHWCYWTCTKLCTNKLYIFDATEMRHNKCGMPFNHSCTTSLFHWMCYTWWPLKYGSGCIFLIDMAWYLCSNIQGGCFPPHATVLCDRWQTTSLRKSAEEEAVADSSVKKWVWSSFYQSERICFNYMITFTSEWVVIEHYSLTGILLLYL